MRPAQLLTILDCEFISTREGHHTPVMLWGPPGVGKSDMIRQTGQRHGAPVIDIRLSQWRFRRMGRPGDPAGRASTRRAGHFVPG